MFGYVMADTEALSEKDAEIYGAYYCGLCRALKKNCGNMSRVTLNYDTAFLFLFLSSVYEPQTDIGDQRCFLHPFSQRPSAENEFAEYAAYMNSVLCYYKYIDDKKDDKSAAAAVKEKLFRNTVKKAEQIYPRQCGKIKDSLLKLEKIEKENVLNPDIPSAVFGELTGSLFAVREDEKAELLYGFGFALGKFIYIADAICDLKKDLEKKRYNPLVLYSSEEFDDTVNMLMADVISAYKKIGIKENTNIIENVLFSGILLKYQILKRRK